MQRPRLVSSTRAKAHVRLDDSSTRAGGLTSEELNSIKRASLCGGWGVKSSQGFAKSQEDAYTVLELSAQLPLPEATAGLLLAVYDGHGGNEVALHAASRLHEHFASSLASAVSRGSGIDAALSWDSADFDALGPLVETLSPPPSPLQERGCSPAFAETEASASESLVSDALRAAFRLTDEELAGTDNGEFVGSTGVVVVLGKSHIWVSHCGDSRAALQRGGSAMALTADHKPSRQDEAARVLAAGGRIVYQHGTPRVMGMLAMTRCIGDHYLRPYIVADPEVMCLERSAEDEVLIIATDGLWDVFSCTEATNMAARCIQRSRERGMSHHGACQVAASVLTQAAIDRRSRDNVTVIVVSMTARDAHDEETELQGAMGAGGRQLRHGLLLKCSSGTCSPGHIGFSFSRQAGSHNDLTRLYTFNSDPTGTQGQQQAQVDDHEGPGQQPQGQQGICTAVEAAAALETVLSLGARLGRGEAKPPRHRLSSESRRQEEQGPAQAGEQAQPNASEIAGQERGAGPHEAPLMQRSSGSGFRVVADHGGTLGTLSPGSISTGFSVGLRGGSGGSSGSGGSGGSSFSTECSSLCNAGRAAESTSSGAFCATGETMQDRAGGWEADRATGDSAVALMHPTGPFAGVARGPAGQATSRSAGDGTSEGSMWAERPPSMPSMLPILAGASTGTHSRVQSCDDSTAGSPALASPICRVSKAPAVKVGARVGAHEGGWAGEMALEQKAIVLAQGHSGDVMLGCSLPTAVSLPGPPTRCIGQNLCEELCQSDAGSGRCAPGQQQGSPWIELPVPGLGRAMAVVRVSNSGGMDGGQAEQWDWSRASVP